MWRTMRSQEGSNARMKDKRQTGCHEGWDGMFSQVSNQLNRFRGINTKSCRRWMSFYSSVRIDNKQYKETETVGGRVSWLEDLSLMMTPGERLFLSLLQGWLESLLCQEKSRVCLPPQSLVSVPDNPTLSCSTVLLLIFRLLLFWMKRFWKESSSSSTRSKRFAMDSEYGERGDCADYRSEQQLHTRLLCTDCTLSCRYVLM